MEDVRGEIVADVKNAISGAQPCLRQFAPRASIVLVGIRATGKTSLGFIAAAQLGRRFVSDNFYFQEVIGMSKGDYLRRYGETTFYHRRVEVFRRMLEECKDDCVIECGILSLAKETRKLLRQFAAGHPVIHITRDMNHVCQVAGLNQDEALRLHELDTEHRKCSNLEFYNLYDPSCRSGVQLSDFSPSSSFVLRDVKLDFQTFIRLTTGKLSLDHRHPASISSMPLERRSYTYAGVLRMSDVVLHRVDLREIISGEDAVEFRIDLAIPNMATEISKCVSAIRRWNPLPIIYHVEEGLFSRHNYIDIIEHGLRLGVEYIQVELYSPIQDLRKIVNYKGYTRLIGIHHFDSDGPGQWCQPNRREAYNIGREVGADLVKLSQRAFSHEDNGDAQALRHELAQEKDGPEVIVYNVGPLGRTSVIFNRILSPVKLSQLQAKEGDDPSLTAKEATYSLFRSFELDHLTYYTLGTFLGKISPSIAYEYAFSLLGLEHRFLHSPGHNPEEFLSAASQPWFGGGVVSSPHKVTMHRMIRSCSQHADAIGAVNTVLPSRTTKRVQIMGNGEELAQRSPGSYSMEVYGENTDWVGIMRCFRKKLSPRNAVNSITGSGVVVGAGGMARASIYAMIHLGCRNIFIHSRSEAKAQAVADHFNALQESVSTSRSALVRVLRGPDKKLPNDVDPPTLIIQCVPSSAVRDMPVSWLQSVSGGVIGNVCYDDKNPLRESAPAYWHLCHAWESFSGLDILAEQGSVQFELLTGRRVPVRMLENIVRGKQHGTALRI